MMKNFKMPLGLKILLVVVAVLAVAALMIWSILVPYVNYGTEIQRKTNFEGG